MTRWLDWLWWRTVARATRWLARLPETRAADAVFRAALKATDRAAHAGRGCGPPSLWAQVVTWTTLGVLVCWLSVAAVRVVAQTVGPWTLDRMELVRQIGEARDRANVAEADATEQRLLLNWYAERWITMLPALEACGEEER